MDIILKDAKNELSQNKIEQVQKKKQEYKLIGSYLRTRGLKLYSYNESTDELKEVLIRYKDTLSLIKGVDELEAKEFSTEEANIDTRNTQFEALNIKSATERVNKWRQGKINDLCNLKKPKKIEMTFNKQP